MLTGLHLLFAGSSSLVWHWGLGIGIIILCLAADIALGFIAVPFMSTETLRKDLLWAAIVVAGLLFGEGIGVHDERARCEAKAAVIQSTVDSAVHNATKPGASGLRDRWDSPDP